MRFGDVLDVNAATGPTGSPQLRFSLPLPEGCAERDDVDSAITRLDRREVEELHEFLVEWLR